MSEEAKPAFRDVEPQELQAMMASGDVQVIDVRGDHEWDAGRIPGSVHIRLDLLSGEPGRLERDRPLVLYCRGGNRSGMAAQAFTEAGWEVRRLSGGILAWEEAGLGLEPEGAYVAESGEAAAVLEARKRAASPGRAPDSN